MKKPKTTFGYVNFKNEGTDVGCLCGIVCCIRNINGKRAIQLDLGRWGLRTFLFDSVSMFVDTYGDTLLDKKNVFQWSHDLECWKKTKKSN